jgi:hypothetical protein
LSYYRVDPTNNLANNLSGDARFCASTLACEFGEANDKMIAVWYYLIKEKFKKIYF